MSVKTMVLADNYDGTIYGIFSFAGYSKKEFHKLFLKAREEARVEIEEYGDDINQVIYKLKEDGVKFSYEPWEEPTPELFI